MKLRTLIYITLAIPLIAVLVWYVAIPERLVTTSLEKAIRNQTQPGIDVSLSGLKKGPLFSMSADTADITVDNVPAVTVTDITTRIDPVESLRDQVTFLLSGKIGTGEILGRFSRHGDGTLTVRDAELNSISYFAATGLQGVGRISADIVISGDTMDVTFTIPDAEITGSPMGVLLPVKAFRKVQGAFSVSKSSVSITSISMEADKGYARLKGTITNSIMNLNLEIMPESGKLESFETMMLSRYQVSPGYYVIPIQGPLL